MNNSKIYFSANFWLNFYLFSINTPALFEKNEMEESAVNHGSSMSIFFLINNLVLTFPSMYQIMWQLAMIISRSIFLPDNSLIRRSKNPVLNPHHSVTYTISRFVHKSAAFSINKSSTTFFAILLQTKSNLKWRFGTPSLLHSSAVRLRTFSGLISQILNAEGMSPALAAAKTTFFHWVVISELPMRLSAIQSNFLLLQLWLRSIHYPLCNVLEILYCLQNV